MVGLLMCTKPDKAVGINAGFQRLHGRDQDVEPQIKLVAIDQEWLGDVLLNHHLLGPMDMSGVCVCVCQ